ncbi:MAG TPA: ATP-binding protein [Acidimicrobiales bacterium]|nr:ATP-binding protein [Acidimicrobiales bacterium]
MELEQIHAYGQQLHSAREARQLVRSALAGLPASAADDVTLVVSELVTNALLHARTGLELEVRAEPGSILVAVRDGSRQQPQRREGQLELGGRGLRIVEALASSWGVDVEPRGKRVWCELPLGPPGDTGTGAAERHSRAR